MQIDLGEQRYKNPAQPRPVLLARAEWQFSTRRLVLFAAFVACISMLIAQVFAGERTPPVESATMMMNWQPATDAERALRTQLRPATRQEQLAISSAVERRGLPVKLQVIADRVNVPVVLNVYVATSDITLPAQPFSGRITIGLPNGKKWADGPLTNVTLVTAAAWIGEPTASLALGDVLHDPVCNPVERSLGMVGEHRCETSQIVTRQQMLKNLKPITVEQADEMVEFGYNPYTSDPEVYLSTDDVVLSPGVGEWGMIDYIIVLAKGHKVLGGRLGNALVIRGASEGFYVPEYPVIEDMLAGTTYHGTSPQCQFFSDKVRTKYAQNCLR